MVKLRQRQSQVVQTHAPALDDALVLQQRQHQQHPQHPQFATHGIAATHGRTRRGAGGAAAEESDVRHHVDCCNVQRQRRPGLLRVQTIGRSEAAR